MRGVGKGRCAAYEPPHPRRNERVREIHIAGLIAVEPQGGKVSRAYAAAPEVESGNVYLPHPLIAPWVGRFIGSAAAFPNAAHDDDVDAFTQAIIRWQEAGQVATAPAQVTSRATIQEMFG